MPAWVCGVVVWGGGGCQSVGGLWSCSVWVTVYTYMYPYTCFGVVAVGVSAYIYIRHTH